MSKECIWYISKYIIPADQSTFGGRGYMIMRELSKRGYCCLIIASDSSDYSSTPKMTSNYYKEVMDGIFFWWVKTYKYFGARSFRRIISWIHFEWRLLRMPKSNMPKPDIIIVSSLSILTILNGLLLRLKYRCKLIFEIRDIWPLTLTEEGGFSKKNPLIWFLGMIEKLGYKYSDAIVGTMPNLQEHVAKVLGYERDVSCVPMGIDPDIETQALPLPIVFKEKYIPDKKFLVMYAGSMGITNALDSFFLCAENFKNNTEIKFLVMGDGYLKEEYQERYKHLSNLIFIPKVPRKMVHSVLKECDLLYFSVLKSEIWKYGQSLNKLIDYMLSGKPIVASYHGFQSMVNEAECGSFISSDEASSLHNEIVRFYNMPFSEREEIGIRGKSWLLSNRNYKKLADLYLQVMCNVLANDKKMS